MRIPSDLVDGDIFVLEDGTLEVFKFYLCTNSYPICSYYNNRYNKNGVRYDNKGPNIVAVKRVRSKDPKAKKYAKYLKVMEEDYITKPNIARKLRAIVKWINENNR